MLWRCHGLGAGGAVMLGACFSGLGTILLQTGSSSSIDNLGDSSLGSPCLWYIEPHSL